MGGTAVSSIPQDILRIAESMIEKAEEKRRNRNRARDLDREIKNLYNNLSSRTLEYIRGLGSLGELDVEGVIGPFGIAEAVACAITFKATQLRKLFYQVKLINQELKGETSIDRVKVSIAKLTPHLAYAKGRELIDESFYRLTKEMLLKVKTPDDFRRFVDIFEAIVAYHRYYNPKEQ